VRCGTRQRVTATGTCVLCPPGTRPLGPGWTCGTVICGPGQVRSDLSGADGACRACPDYTRPTAGGDRCHSDCVGPTTIVNKDGTCTVCQLPSKPDSARHSCVIATCQPGTALNPLTGDCVRCAPFTRLQPATGQCAADPCVGGTTLSDGTCSLPPPVIADGPCPTGSTKYTEDTAKTVVGAIEGQCGRVCGPREKTEDGICLECGRYKRSNAERTTCVDARTTCPSDQVAEPDGTCRGCQAYEKLNTVAKKCERPDCTGRTVPTREGDCEPCGDYEVPFGPFP
jgi:hypothetical protein